MTESDRKELSHALYCVLREGISFEESQKNYKEWSVKGNYDKLHTDLDCYIGLSKLQQNADKYFTDKENQLILDLGAGSGLSGLQLRNIGFKNMHALEPLKEFADEAMGKGIYSKMYNQTIGHDKPIDTPDDTYDGIVSCGSFGPGHIPTKALHEIVRIIKPGGYFIMCMRKEYIQMVDDYKTGLERLMTQLETDGKWKMVVKETYPKHFMDKDGLVFVFQIL